MLIVGGWADGGASTKVEIISPGTGKQIDHCLIKSLPERRDSHTISKGTVCGGDSSGTQSNCIEMQQDGTWKKFSLNNRRFRVF